MDSEVKDMIARVAPYQNLNEDQLWELVRKGKIFRTFEEKFSDGYYCGTTYLFWATHQNGVHNDFIKSFFHPTLFNN